MLGKPIEFWIAVIGAMLYVAERHHTRRLLSRIILVGSSAGLGVGLAPDVAAWSGWSETIVAVVLIVFGYLLLDLGTALIADREFMKSIIRNRLGGGGGGR